MASRGWQLASLIICQQNKRQCKLPSSGSLTVTENDLFLPGDHLSDTFGRWGNKVFLKAFFFQTQSSGKDVLNVVGSRVHPLANRQSL